MARQLVNASASIGSNDLEPLVRLLEGLTKDIASIKSDLTFLKSENIEANRKIVSEKYGETVAKGMANNAKALAELANKPVPITEKLTPDLNEYFSGRAF
ncbi:hypothetical protein PSH58_03380 [Pseudomonas hefeiensis]|uniref:Uncharacterized protein n=1 Tax=Pseudomonas hefeiensis TaxID=2738125 RepID=A0ABY9GCZ3_9PSED|nr:MULTISPECIES: hypothetical protein [unclassified Pseudomonas]WLH13421.1 hypothetical protein PSH57_03385 [Pseudomonas sp. FP205]WLH96477.1 hypothetical protein PSH58_03380 [Pseudomonas sp. FP53]WLI40756.1 hypothetical protein PSH74_03385 [Pseudomonas sp. FP821]